MTPCSKQVIAWAEKNKVDVTIDFITSNGFKIQITQAAEAQARTGHDFLPFYNWEVNTYAEQLEPMDDVVKAMTAPVRPVQPDPRVSVEDQRTLAALPSSTGTLNLNCCARISLLKQHAGIDILAMYPAHKSDPKAAADWTYDTFLKAAEACQKAGFAFGLGLGQTGDSVNNTGIIYSAFGAELVNAKGEITVDSDAVHQVLDYARKLAKFLPPDTVSYDDASNNRALISGQERADHEPAFGLVGGEARCAEGGRGLLDLPVPGRSEGPVQSRTTTASSASGRSARTSRRRRSWRSSCRSGRRCRSVTPPRTATTCRR